MASPTCGYARLSVETIKIVLAVVDDAELNFSLSLGNNIKRNTNRSLQNPPENAMTSNTIALSGYQISEQIYEGSRTLVYRGMRETDSQPAIVKVLRNPHPHFKELVQFRNQYIITRHLDSPHIVRPLALERHGNGYALVMSDEGAIALGDYWQKSDRNLSLFLNIAIQLSEALHYLGQQRIIHKDIKPANILICPERQQIQLIDFSISSLLPKETQQIQNPNILEGTLAYISPEQTGRMNRGIDYRTDFYSLGITFYELLTGKLPFQTEDPMELVHCHIAKTPTLVTSTAIPQMLSKIVMKLMAKNVEGRYQSALGLKHDLERCLRSLETTGEIADFELGEQDRCDRFIIPEKLYGREGEVSELLAAFARVSQGAGAQGSRGDRENSGNSELFLVAGFSGIGKTAVVNEVHKPIVQQRGYFIKGKFDQFNRNIPFSAFVQSFRDLMGQLLSESDVQLQQWKSKILDAVGENGQVIIEVIPELAGIIGQQPPVPELEGSAAQNRFNLLFGKFIQVFTTKEHPLVLFLDDLQWADSASLNLLKLLMGETEKGYLLVLGAYRDNEVYPAHPLMLTLDDIKKNEAIVNTIALDALTQSALNYLVADTLSCRLELAFPLTELIYQKTKGNPFFATQFLKGLHEDGWISFDPELGYWQCDLLAVRQLSLTEDVVEFMATQLQKLSTETQEVLKLAACIGNQFDLATLAIVNEHSETETATALWKALQEGLVLPTNEVYKFYQSEENAKALSNSEERSPSYKFLHDRIQQAAYSLIPDDRKQITHYQIGQLLLQQTPPEGREEKIFELVSQLNYGTILIAERRERDELAQLNLVACQKAKGATAYQAGYEYANKGLSLLGDRAWQRQYAMSLAFHNLAAESASLCGDFEAMEQFVERVIQQAKSVLEQVHVYRINILSNVSRHNITNAIAIAQQILQKLGVNLSQTPSPQDIQQEIAEISELIGDRDIETLVSLPTMTDDRYIAMIQIAVSIMPAAYMVGSPLFSLLVTLSVKLSLQSGNTSASAFGYLNYGILACNLLQAIESGVKFGNLALELINQLEDKTGQPEIVNGVSLFLLHRQVHIQNTLPLLQKSYVEALEVGNLEHVGYGAGVFCINSFSCAQPLSTLQKKAQTYYTSLVQLNQLNTANWCRIYWQLTSNLLGSVEQPTRLSGEAFQEAEFLTLLHSSHDLFGLYFFHLYKLMLFYLFEDITSAQSHALEVKRYFKAAMGTVGEPAFYFYDTLTIVAQFRSQSLENSSDRVSELWQRIEENQTRLQQQWANYAPINHQHKVDLVEAEKFRVLGQKVEAIEFYDRAISGAKTNEFLQEEALANELAAKFYLDWGKEKVASGYMQEAYYCYARWGAKAKTDDLEKRYPQLLQPILQKSSQSINLFDTLTTLAQPKLSVHSSVEATQSSTTLNTVLDVASVLKACQAISEIIHFDELLKQLTQIILQNSGSDRCALILPDRAGESQVRAIATPKETQMFVRPLNNDCDLPVKLIQYVKNTQEIVVIDDLKTDLPVVDDYLRKHQPKSVLGLPMLNQGRCIGIISLENHLASGLFTGERIPILNFLSTQAAISIQNSLLYKELERSLLKAQKTSQELEETVALSKGQQQILALIAQGVPLTQILEETALYIESQSHHAAYCSFLFIDAGGRLRHAAAPSLPADFCALVDGLPIGPEVGSCGTAAYCKASVTVTDIATDPLWANYQVALDFGLHACASTPILGAEGQVLATLAMYQPEPGEFTRHDRQLMEAATYLARIAIERHQADIELQQLNLQMIQGEKMATLGNLVAGIAHEVNNPIGFLNGSINNTKDYVQELFEYLDTYQSQQPPNDVVQESAEEIELEFILEDLPKLLDSMQNATDRIKKISNSLRTFSRTDADKKTSANLHEGLDSTLLILKYRLKANEQRPAIQVIKEYGELPEVDCFPSQLNQAFMNILANAIDAFEEVNQGKTYAEIEVNPNCITICTSIVKEQVTIQLKDNGCGMKPEIRERIFEQGFTTKDVGKGTGLGMAIARQIVEEKHGGTLTCHSELGKGTTFTILLPLA